MNVLSHIDVGIIPILFNPMKPYRTLNKVVIKLEAIY